MKNTVVISPKCCSLSAKRLAYLLDCPWLLAEEKDYSEYKQVINYGSSFPQKYKKIINSPQSVKICCNKIATLKRLSPSCSTIEWTREVTKAAEWLKKDGVVVIRQLEQGSQGKGLIYANTLDILLNTPAKLYTRYFHHTNEVRVNVYKDKILSVFDKVILDNGENTVFEFVPLKIEGRSAQIDQMINTIRETIGVDYYGIDVLYNGEEYKLLEVNSGPILYPQTEKGLVKAIKEECK